MYNRYILQSDGSYRKKRIEDPAAQLSEPPSPPPQVVEELSPAQEDAAPVSAPPPADPPQRCPQPQRQDSANGFLRNLLPKNLDTGDLLIIILLLLMSSDNPSDSNTALLTLALYLFL